MEGGVLIFFGGGVTISLRTLGSVGESAGNVNETAD